MYLIKWDKQNKNGHLRFYNKKDEAVLGSVIVILYLSVNGYKWNATTPLQPILMTS